MPSDPQIRQSGQGRSNQVSQEERGGEPVDIQQLPQMAATHYDVLGVSPTASLEEIKAAHRKLSLLYHPDKQKKSHQTIEGSVKDGHEHESPAKRSSLHDIDGDDEDEDTIDRDESDMTERLNNVKLDGDSQANCSKAEANDGDNTNSTEANGEEKQDASESVDPSSDRTSKCTFRQIHTAWETLRDPTKRAAYDADLALKSEKKASMVDKAVLVKLSEMEEILFQEEDGEYDNGTDEHYGHVDDADSDDENYLVAYCYQCRCGDEIQVLQEELLGKYQQTNSDNANVFECPSCCLCIRVEIDMPLDDL